MYNICTMFLCVCIEAKSRWKNIWIWMFTTSHKQQPMIITNPLCIRPLCFCLDSTVFRYIFTRRSCRNTNKLMGKDKSIQYNRTTSSTRRAFLQFPWNDMSHNTKLHFYSTNIIVFQTSIARGFSNPACKARIFVTPNLSTTLPQ